MKTTVKNLSDTRVRVSFTLGAEELEVAEQVALRHFAKSVKINGFRKGRAPLAVVKKNVDPNELAQETLDNALSRAVAEGFMSHDIRVLERPAVEVKKFVPGELIEFTAEADVIPPVKLGDYKKLKVEKADLKVSESDIDEVVERIRQGFSEKKETKDAAKLGDEAVIDFVGKRDGKAFDGGAGNDYPLTLGSNSFIPGFEEALVGLKAGDKKDVPLTFPKEYHSKELAGKKVVFEVTVKKVNKVTLPELNDELAAKIGPFTAVSDLRDDIKRELEAQKAREASDKQKDSLVRQLAEKSKVSIPQVLIDDQIQSIEQDLAQNLMYQGMDLEKYYEMKGFADRDAWIKGEANEAGELRAKMSLVLSELSKELKIDATADELAEQINNYKQQYAKNEEMAKRFDEPEVQREVANRLIMEKTVDKLVELNTK